MVYFNDSIGTKLLNLSDSYSSFEISSGTSPLLLIKMTKKSSQKLAHENRYSILPDTEEGEYHSTTILIKFLIYHLKMTSLLSSKNNNNKSTRR